MLDGKITDLLEARSLLYKADNTDIKTMSWGPNDDGSRMEHPQTYVSQALEEGVRIVSDFIKQIKILKFML